MIVFPTVVFPADSAVEATLGARGDLVRWDLLEDLPHHNDPRVRRARGQRGESFFSALQKVLVREYWSEQRRELECAVYFSTIAEGTPGCVHGGAIASTFDHVFGRMLLRAVGFVGHATLNLSVDFRKFVPIDTVVRVSCASIERDGRKVRLRARMTNADASVVYADCAALFYNTTAKEFPYADAVAIFKPMSLEEYMAAVTNPATAAERAKPKDAKVVSML